MTEAIRSHVDGQAALETVRELSRFHRVQGSPGFAAATEMLLAKLRRAGFSGPSASIEKFPADGRTRYAHSDIRDVLSGRYAPVPQSEVAGYFELLVRAKAVTLSR